MPDPARTTPFLSRRQVLGALAAGAGALAGCADGDSAGGFEAEIDERLGRDSTGAAVSPSLDVPADRVFRAQIPRHPDSAHFLWDVGAGVDVPLRPAEPIYAATHEPGLWGRWYHESYWTDPGQTSLGSYERYEIADNRIAVTIREDAYWSDGEPVRAYDAKAQFAFWRLPPDVKSEGGDVWELGPGEAERFGVHAATREVRLPEGPDGRRIEFYAREGDGWSGVDGYAAFPRGRLLAEIGGPAPRHGVRYPAHVEPYASIAAEATDLWEERPPEPPSRARLSRDHVSPADVERSRDADRYVSNGPWTLGEVGDERVVLAPNEHSRHADDRPFDAVVVERVDVPLTWAGLEEGRYDYARVDVPDHVVADFPDRIREVTAPSAAGFAIAVDQASALGDVRVRQALLQALETASIAENIHPTATDPVTVPGWDTWGMETALDESWATERLIDYTYDPEAAAAKLREAGYERDDGVWTRDGEPLRLRFGTDYHPPAGRFVPDNDAGFEETAIDQLEEFGVEVDFESREPATFEARWRGSDRVEPFDREYGGAGAFDLWSGRSYDNRVAGHYRGIAEHFSAALARRDRVRARNYFDHGAQEAALGEYDDDGRIDGRYSLWKEWTIELPPLGVPEGEREPFNPAYTWATAERRAAGAAAPQPENPYYDPPRREPHAENRTHFWRTFAWTLNWFLPVLPITRTMNQHFVDAEAWRWPTDGDRWETFGVGWDGLTLLGLNAVSL